MKAAAAESGQPMSSPLLAKWRRAGLLPRPVQRSMGRGRGTVAIYPAGSTAQLLRLLAIRAEHEAAPADGRAERGRFNPDRALWRLWWEGWPVNPGKVRDALSDTLRTWEAALGELDRVQDADDGDPWGTFETDRLPPALADVRNRVGKSAFSTVGRLVLNAASGRFAGFLPVASVGNDVQDDGDDEIMGKALGVAGVARAVGVPSMAAGGMVEETLSEYSEAVGVGKLRATLDVTDDAALATARADLRAALAIAWGVLADFGAAHPRSSPAHNPLRWSPDDAADHLPGFVLVALALRRDPTLRPILDHARRLASAGGAA